MNPFGVDVERRSFVTGISGRAALVVDIDSDPNHQRSIFVYASTGRCFGLDITGTLQNTADNAVRVEFNVSLAALENNPDGLAKFNGYIQCDNIAIPTTRSALFTPLDMPTNLFAINWPGLIACAPTCISCWKSLPCWIACAAGCVANNI